MFTTDPFYGFHYNTIKLIIFLGLLIVSNILTAPGSPALLRRVRSLAVTHFRPDDRS